MDIATLTSVIGIVIAVASLSVAFFALDEHRRAELRRFWKKWLSVVFYFVLVVNSGLGIYFFLQGPPQLVRADVSKLLLHLFNLIAVPLALFMNAMLGVMDKRDAKRAELAAALETLTERFNATQLAGSPEKSVSQLTTPT